MISCLCITSKRRIRFREWLLWNYTKQGHHDRQLVVVSDDDDWPPWVKLKIVSSNLTVPQKRNIALDIVNSTMVTWFDDDDWQHPDKCGILATNVVPGVVVGSKRSFFLSPRSMKGVDIASESLIFNSIGVLRDTCPEFNEETPVASDAEWMRIVLAGSRVQEVDGILSFFLVHNDNISNKEHRIRPHLPVTIDELGEETWQAVKKLGKLLQEG